MIYRISKERGRLALESNALRKELKELENCDHPILDPYPRPGDWTSYVRCGECGKRRMLAKVEISIFRMIFPQR